jgi:hypothetical protein
MLQNYLNDSFQSIISNNPKVSFTLDQAKIVANYSLTFLEILRTISKFKPKKRY